MYSLSFDDPNEVLGPIGFCARTLAGHALHPPSERLSAVESEMSRIAGRFRLA